MISTIKDKPETVKPSPFPVLKRNTNTDFIVLFSDTNRGTVVYSAHPGYKVGFHDAMWRVCTDSGIWKDCDKEVVLSN